MEKAYSVLSVKSMDDDGDQRVIRGVATTPRPDRVGDVVVPTGVKFLNPVALLWQHRRDEPVGIVKFDKPTRDGIQFEARIARVSEPGRLKDRVDEAWQSIKAGLVAAVSIGFRPVRDAMEILPTGGIKYLESEVIELSLVTIGANAEAVITAIKSMDTSDASAGDKDVPEPAAAIAGQKRGPVLLKQRRVHQPVKIITARKSP
jgi:HK97 family phage prohead protease